MAKLILQLADGTTRDVLLGRERMTIGRRADNDVCLPFPAVSGEHASVVTILADSFLEDLGSTNGTLVNGKPIVKHFLRDHDQIDIGRQLMVFMSDDNARVDPLPLEVTSNRLLGLEVRVESARPAPPMPDASAAKPRDKFADPPLFMIPDLQEEGSPEPLAAVVPRRDAAPARSPFAERRPPPTRRETDQRLAAWAAEWAAPTGDTGVGPVDTSAAAKATSRVDAASGTMAASRDDVASEPALPQLTVRVLSGPSLGRVVPFNKDELSVGRVGVQVAVVRKIGNGFMLVPVEGTQPPHINGAPVAPEGTVLHPGDTFEVAGVRLVLSMTN